ncbi:MAG: TetR/AcrR family transcriptional regulator [Mycobacterium sp.]
MEQPRRQPAGGRRRRQTHAGVVLSADVYIAAAVNLIENRGAGVLSTRTLARAVGADPSALYRYFGGIDDLLRAVADRMIGIALDNWTPDDDWLTSLATLARAIYQVYVRDFPQTGYTVASRTTGLENETRAVEITLGLLRDGGFDDNSAAVWFRSLTDFLLGQAMLESAYGTLPSEVQAADSDRWREFPAAASPLHPVMIEPSFEASMTLILRGLAASPRDTSTSPGRPIRSTGP